LYIGIRDKNPLIMNIEGREELGGRDGVCEEKG